MNYEEMSDFEINKWIWRLTKSPETMYINNETMRVFRDVAERYDFDPCNNPSDAFPIIVDNGISLVWMDAKVSYYEAHGINEDKGDEDWHSQHPNALRAAMICFLKMKDAEK